MTRPNKYRARKTSVDGITFDSQAEAFRYGSLKLLEKAGDISGLKLQPEYAFMEGGKKAFRYTADFQYLRGNQVIIEDVKGVDTDASRLRRKLTELRHGVEVRVIDRYGNPKKLSRRKRK